MTEKTDAPTDDEKATDEGEQKQEQTFTQADIDRIVKDRLAQQAKNQFGDYNELKAKAEGAKTVEQKLVDIEQKYTEAEARALRSDIAAKHGIDAIDRDLFLTGSDESTLTAQATRLVAREADRKKHGNVAPKEGEAKTTGGSTADLREFAKGLFGNTD